MVARIDGTPYEPGGDAANAATRSGSTPSARAETTPARTAATVDTTPARTAATVDTTRSEAPALLEAGPT